MTHSQTPPPSLSCPEAAEEIFVQTTAACTLLGDADPCVAELTAIRDRALAAMADTDAAAGTALAAALDARDTALTRAVLARWTPEAGWMRVNRQSRAPGMGTLMAELRLDLLEACAAGGLVVRSELHHLVTAARNADRGDALEVARRLRAERPLSQQGRLRAGVLRGGPGCAPVLWGVLEMQFDDPKGRGMRAILADGAQGATMKELAVLLASGRNIRSFLAEDLPDFHPAIRALIEQTASAHGQLRLREMEPDQIAVLGRPMTDTFYGISGRSFHADYPPAGETSPS